jgi:hypothetical protein
VKLLDRGGYIIVEGLLSPVLLDDLRSDARERFATASRTTWTEPDTEEWRGGHPARAYYHSNAGPIQYTLFCDATVVAIISDLCGVALEVSGGGTYSYYHEPGDFLALHRDIVRCDIATVTCLDDNVDSMPRGGLRVYPGYLNKPLSSIRTNRPQGLDLPCRPGQTIILAGGMLPHEVTPALAGQHRTVSISCYRADWPEGKVAS